MYECVVVLGMKEPAMRWTCSPGPARALPLASVLLTYSLGGCADSARSGDSGLADDAGRIEIASDAGDSVALCARPADDAVRDVFCKGGDVHVTSLRELEARLQLSALPANMDEAEAAMIVLGPTQLFATACFLGHSTALFGSLVSPINPRAIVVNEHTLLAFHRGIQELEIATRDRATGRMNFYLVSFRQACNDAPEGCLPGDLYTPSVERDWTSVALHDDEDLKNTPFDCRQCHQRKLEKPTVLMREVSRPWAHFFAYDSEVSPYQEGQGMPGRDLVREYLRAKGRESYAGIAAGQLRQTSAALLATFIDHLQLRFDPGITLELDADSAMGAPRRSAAWDRVYEAFKRGEMLALPYFEDRPTDLAKQTALSEAYGRYQRGEIPARELPDLADIFPDDPQVRAEIGLQTEPNATPAQTLVQACGTCHNDVLDQSISRARFNIALSRMSREQLDAAAARIERAPDSAGVMPPIGTRQLDPEGKKRLVEYLKRNERSADDDALLDSAARFGMANY